MHEVRSCRLLCQRRYFEPKKTILTFCWINDIHRIVLIYTSNSLLVLYIFLFLVYLKIMLQNRLRTMYLLNLLFMKAIYGSNIKYNTDDEYLETFFNLLYDINLLIIFIIICHQLITWRRYWTFPEIYLLRSI